MILHAIPTFINQNEYGAGNWKALESNRLAFKRAGLPTTEIIIDPKNLASVMDQVPADISHLLIEYSLWPDLLTQLKTKHPHVKIHIRAHNAEAYQHFHRNKTHLRDCANLSLWNKCLQIAWRDSRSLRAADTLLGISDWDNVHYWRWLPGKARIEYLPYYSPWSYLRPQVDTPDWNLRKPIILSMGGNFDPSGKANYTNFDMLATKLSSRMHEKWSYLLTWWSQWHNKVPKVSTHIEIVRECREPWDLLCQTRALAVLTHLGFGFKTTIVDGLAAGCHVIVHPKLAERLPLQVRQLCLSCDPSREED